MARPPPVVALAVLFTVLLAPACCAAVSRPRRTLGAVFYTTTHPSGSDPVGGSSSSYFSQPSPPSLPITAPSFPFDQQPADVPGVPPGPPAPRREIPGLPGVDPDNNPYGNVPPPPPPPPGPPPPYTVNPARGLTYETAPQSPPGSSYAPSPRISYGRVGVLARVGYTAPPIEVAAPALLFTNAKDGGLADTQEQFDGLPPFTPTYYRRPAFRPPPPYNPPSYNPPPYTPSPYNPTPYTPSPYNPSSFGPAYSPSYNAPRLLTTPRGGRVLFRPSQPLPPPTAPAAPPPPTAPPLDPSNPAPLRFDQNFNPPPVSPILLSRNRAGDSYYLGGVTNYLR